MTPSAVGAQGPTHISRPVYISICVLLLLLLMFGPLEVGMRGKHFRRPHRFFFILNACPNNKGGLEMIYFVDILAFGGHRKRPLYRKIADSNDCDDTDANTTGCLHNHDVDLYCTPAAVVDLKITCFDHSIGRISGASHIQCGPGSGISTVVVVGMPRRQQ